MDAQVRTAKTDVSRRDLTVTAAEDIREASAVDFREHTCGSSSITAAEDATDGIVATVDIYLSLLGAA